jgi:hypothetical protein
MIQPISEYSTSFYPSHRIVRIETLGETGNTLSHATGFLVNERDGLSLYTCWHVVVGFDPTNQPKSYPPKRCKLRVFAIKAEPLIADDNVSVIGERIGGQIFVDIALYGNDGSALWIQHQSSESLFDGNLSIPYFDCVRIIATEYESAFRFFFEARDVHPNNLDLGGDCFIVGFPYGYSPKADTPLPTFLKRSLASIGSTNGGADLLDGPGAYCMSGCPILFKYGGDWKIVGLYLGVAFPEALRFGSEKLDAEGSKLPLGKFLSITLVRAVLGAIY